MHVFKLELERNSLFIHSIDWVNEEIVYEVRDKNTGELVEPKCKSHIEFGTDRIFFGTRHIVNDLAKHIIGILN